MNFFWPVSQTDYCQPGPCVVATPFRKVHHIPPSVGDVSRTLPSANRTLFPMAHHLSLCFSSSARWSTYYLKVLKLTCDSEENASFYVFLRAGIVCIIAPCCPTHGIPTFLRRKVKRWALAVVSHNTS